MKPKLENKPNNYKLHELLVNFQNGVPLTPNQLNFIYRHEKALSALGLDPVLKYYLKHFYNQASDHQSFLMHRENFNAKAAKELKRRLSLLLQGAKNKKERIKLKLTAKQFQELKNSAYPALIFYHGNHMMTGAPFYLGGIPHVVFFQWGNLFGVAKYVVLAEEKALRSNLMVHFELIHERTLSECVKDFNHDMRHELKPDPHHANTHHLEKQAPQENYRPSPFAIPKLTLARGSSSNDESNK